MKKYEVQTRNKKQGFSELIHKDLSFVTTIESLRAENARLRAACEAVQKMPLSELNADGIARFANEIVPLLAEALKGKQ